MSTNIYKPPINFNENGDSTTPITRLNAVDPLTYNNRTSDLTIKAANENNYGVITTGNQIIRGNKNFIDGITVDSLSLNNLNITSGKITKEPENETDIVNKKYVGSSIDTIKEETNKEMQEINNNISYLKDNIGDTNQKELRLYSIFDWNYSNNSKLIVKALYSVYKNKYILKFSKETYLMYFTTSAYTTNKLFISFYQESTEGTINNSIYDLMPNSFEILCQIKYNSNFKSRIINFEKGNYTIENSEGTTEKHIGYNCTTDFNLEEYKGNGCKFLEDKFFNCYFDNQDLTNINNIETKNLNLTTGTIETTPIKDNDIINKKYLDSSVNTTITTINNLSDSIDTMNDKLTNIEAGVVSESTINKMIDNKLIDMVKYDDTNKTLNKNDNTINSLNINDIEISQNLKVNKSVIDSNEMVIYYFKHSTPLESLASDVTSFIGKYSDSSRLLYAGDVVNKSEVKLIRYYLTANGEYIFNDSETTEIKTALDKMSLIGSQTEFKFLCFALTDNMPNGGIAAFDVNKNGFTLHFYKLPQVSDNYQNYKFYKAGKYNYFVDITSTPNLNLYQLNYNALSTDKGTTDLIYNSSSFNDNENNNLYIATNEKVFNFVPLENKELFILFDDNQRRNFKIFNIKPDFLNNESYYNNINYYNHYTELTVDNLHNNNCALYFEESNNCVHIFLVDNYRYITYYKYYYNSESTYKFLINDYAVDDNYNNTFNPQYIDFTTYNNHFIFIEDNNKYKELNIYKDNKLYNFRVEKANLLFNKQLTNNYIFITREEIIIIDLENTIKEGILRFYKIDNNINNSELIDEIVENNNTTFTFTFKTKTYTPPLISTSRIVFKLSACKFYNGTVEDLATNKIYSRDIKTDTIETNNIKIDNIDNDNLKINCGNLTINEGTIKTPNYNNLQSIININYLNDIINDLKSNYCIRSYKMDIEEIYGVVIGNNKINGSNPDKNKNFIIVQQYNGCNVIKIYLEQFYFDDNQKVDGLNYLKLCTTTSDIGNIGLEFKNNINFNDYGEGDEVEKSAQVLLLYRKDGTDFKYNPSYIYQTMIIRNNKIIKNYLEFEIQLKFSETTGDKNQYANGSSCPIIDIGQFYII